MSTGVKKCKKTRGPGATVRWAKQITTLLSPPSYTGTQASRKCGVGARGAMWLIRHTFIHVAPSLELLLPRRAGSCPPDVEVPAAEAREAAERRRRARRKTRSKAAQKRQDDQDFEAL